jgi:hypothetical protein
MFLLMVLILHRLVFSSATRRVEGHRNPAVRRAPRSSYDKCCPVRSGSEFFHLAKAFSYYEILTYRGPMQSTVQAFPETRPKSSR